METSGKELDELLASLPDPKRERGGRTELLGHCLDEVVDGELGRLARDSGLSPRELHEAALRNPDELLSDAKPVWKSLVDARRDQRRLEVRRMEGESTLLYTLRIYQLTSTSPRLAGSLLGGALGLGAVFLLARWVIGHQLSLPVLVVGGVAAFFLLGRYLNFVMFAPALTGADVAAEAADAQARAYATQVREGVAGWLREWINESQRYSYDTSLRFGDRSGLAEVDDPKHEIPTGAKEELVALVENEAMPGGAIGLAGPRGAGKSTLMRSLCEELESTEGTLGAMVDAPTDYDPRDFVLHLFAQVCTRVVGRRKVAGLRGLDGLVQVDGRVDGMPPVSFLAGSGLLIAGFALLLSRFPGEGPLSRMAPMVAAFGLSALGVAFLARSILREGPRRRRQRLVRDLLETGTKDGRTALSWLQQIWFQRTFASGWSGSFKSAFGLESAVSGGTELADRQMSFPEIVDAFRRFLEQISQTRQVRIGIDELDKMDDDTARAFLNEIKVVFRVPGCFFLISISEDAMSYFERRGLPIRDVFDSSFDDVVWVPCLQLESSRRLLARRIVGLPQPFVCLVHCLSGGLPRDLIRAARKLVDMPRGTTLRNAVTRMCRHSLDSKLNGARVAARKFRSEATVQVLVEWLDHLREAQASPFALLEASAETMPRFLIPLADTEPSASSADETAEIKALGLQLAAATYLSATTREFFGAFESEDFVDFAVRPEGGESRVDWLAGIPQKLAEDLAAGWADLSLLREDCGMDAVDFPSDPPPPDQGGIHHPLEDDASSHVASALSSSNGG